MYLSASPRPCAPTRASLTLLCDILIRGEVVSGAHEFVGAVVWTLPCFHGYTYKKAFSGGLGCLCLRESDMHELTLDTQSSTSFIPGAAIPPFRTFSVAGSRADYAVVPTEMSDTGWSMPPPIEGLVTTGKADVQP